MYDYFKYMDCSLPEVAAQQRLTLFTCSGPGIIQLTIHMSQTIQPPWPMFLNQSNRPYLGMAFRTQVQERYGICLLWKYLSQPIFRPTKSYWSDLSSFESELVEGSNTLLSSCLAVSPRSDSSEYLSNNMPATESSCERHSIIYSIILELMAYSWIR